VSIGNCRFLELKFSAPFRKRHVYGTGKRRTFKTKHLSCPMERSEFARNINISCSYNTHCVLCRSHVYRMEPIICISFTGSVGMIKNINISFTVVGGTCDPVKHWYT
jgi:hypothetical protein